MLRQGLVIAFLGLHATIAAATVIRENAPFKFQLEFSDHLRWQDGDGPVQDQINKMAENLLENIEAANKSVDIAIYGISDQDWFLQAIKEKIQSRVAIHTIVDQKKGELGDWIPENFTYKDTPKLANFLNSDELTPDLNGSGNPRTSSIMHNKVLVFDSKKVWIGSANISATGVGDEYNANLAITIDSSEVAKIYRKELLQMSVNKRFSRQKHQQKGSQSVIFSDRSRVDIYFAPQDNPTLNAILPFIKKAKSSLDIAMFFLTEPTVAQELINAHKRGVKVRLIQDALSASHPSTRHHILRAAGIDVKIENWGGKMHMKAAAADGEYLLMGSMNWTANGNNKNDENIIVIRNKKVAAAYGENFNEMWNSLPSARVLKLLGKAYDPRAEGRDSINSCYDGIDNDHDQLTDLEEPDCQ